MTRRIAVAMPAIAFAPQSAAAHAQEPFTPFAIDRTSPKAMAEGLSGFSISDGRTDGVAKRLLSHVLPPAPAAPQCAGNGGSRHTAAVGDGPA
ncbi:hypothetical protein HL658_17795 [Azospirillum sp. RWY-5-1]|uniref:Uncharacterized protein n=1 Tax=Azospirillum oleiclasticum TaxID=2735135 RepID=A0ABX2TKS8_9PROT|nr:hypothetical protein [Azospirillum oleiclasticum]NYZ14408.1 hypothetical protein [Azospirillum oleiclasticum]NYZ23240.1 hypothetical protein [Azospirillum oleiclasticum]